MDNKPLELQAEKLIEHKLIKYGFLVTKPSFDKEGTDLLIVKDISQKTTPFIKVQCKGRTIKNTSHVTIPKKYVEENFVVVLYAPAPQFYSSRLALNPSNIVVDAVGDKIHSLGKSSSCVGIFSRFF